MLSAGVVFGQQSWLASMPVGATFGFHRRNRPIGGPVKDRSNQPPCEEPEIPSPSRRYPQRRKKRPQRRGRLPETEPAGNRDPLSYVLSSPSEDEPELWPPECPHDGAGFDGAGL